MSNFIPKVQFEVYPGLVAHLWEDTPTWVLREGQALPTDQPALEWFAARVALSVFDWSGEHAPTWPHPVRGEGQSDAAVTRQQWCVEHLPLRAMQRVMQEVGKRCVLSKDEAGN